MRTYVTLAAVAVAAATAYAGPAGGTPTTASAPAAEPVALDTMLDSDPVLGPSFDLRWMLESDPELPVLTEPAHDHASHVQPPPVVAPETSRVVASGRWRTPEAAMRFLASAYTRNDDAALRKVTTANARRDLVQMRSFAPDLRLDTCTDGGSGSYLCTFTHAIKGHTQRGSATLQVSPAAKPGWYASMLVDCG